MSKYIIPNEQIQTSIKLEIILNFFQTNHSARPNFFLVSKCITSDKNLLYLNVLCSFKQKKLPLRK